MRKKSELIQIVINNFDTHFYTGLCKLISTLNGKGTITDAEFFTLDKVFRKYIVKETNTKKHKSRIIDAHIHREEAYFWEAKERKPRLAYLKWLHKKMLKLEKQSENEK